MAVSISDVFASLIQKPAAIVFFFIAGAYWLYLSIKSYQKKGIEEGVTTMLFYFGVLIAAPGILIFFTEWIALNAPRYELTANVNADTLRWLSIYAIIVPLITLLTFRHSNVRTGIIVLIHLLITNLGWFLAKWEGIILISMPIFFIFYYLLYELAQVVIPSSNPESFDEKKNKFFYVTWTVFGLQYPLWYAKSSATRESEMRISGRFIKPFGTPGIMWTHPHQVVARSTGIELNRIDGPGAIFTGRSERPVTLVDLRTQLRPTPFTAITRDGVKVKAFAFISFQIDRRDWNEWERERKHEILRITPVLGNQLALKKDPFYSWPYAPSRVHAALSASTINMNSNEDSKKEVHWDEVAVQRVVEKASLVLSDRNFDELWRPTDDGRTISAIDEMSSRIVEKATPELDKMGVNLFGSRVVNFIIDEETPIYKELLNEWIFKREQENKEIQFSGQIKAEEIVNRAKMRSRTEFLSIVSGTLTKIENINPNLLRHLTTLNLVGLLEKLLENTKDQNHAEQTARIAAWGSFYTRQEGEDE